MLDSFLANEIKDNMYHQCRSAVFRTFTNLQLLPEDFFQYHLLERILKEVVKRISTTLCKNPSDVHWHQATR
jgi:hypothetical protein